MPGLGWPVSSATKIGFTGHFNWLKPASFLSSHAKASQGNCTRHLTDCTASNWKALFPIAFFTLLLFFGGPQPTNFSAEMCSISQGQLSVREMMEAGEFCTLVPLELRQTCRPPGPCCFASSRVPGGIHLQAVCHPAI